MVVQCIRFDCIIYHYQGCCNFTCIIFFPDRTLLCDMKPGNSTRRWPSISVLFAIPPLDDGSFVFFLLVYSLAIGLALTWLVVWLRTSHLRKDPGRWPQVVAVVAVLLDALWDLIYGTMVFGDSDIFQMIFPCHAFLVVTWFTDLLLPLALNVLTIERLRSLWKGDPKDSGLNRLASLVTSCVLSAVPLILAGVFLYALGRPRLVQDGRSVIWACRAPRKSYMARGVVYAASDLVLLVSTCVLAGKLCYSQRRDPEPYPTGRVLHIIIGNLVLLAEDIAVIAQVWVLREVYGVQIIAYILVLVLWLVVDRSVRAAYSGFCCTCIKKAAPDDTVELVNSWTHCR